MILYAIQLIPDIYRELQGTLMKLLSSDIGPIMSTYLTSWFMLVSSLSISILIDFRSRYSRRPHIDSPSLLRTRPTSLVGIVLLQKKIFFTLAHNLIEQELYFIRAIFAAIGDDGGNPGVKSCLSDLGSNLDPWICSWLCYRLTVATPLLKLLL
jgi:hypothetical protein